MSLSFLKLGKAQLVAIGDRVVAAFAVAFVASVAGSGVLSLAHVTDLSLWSKAGLAGVAGVVTLVQSTLSQLLAGVPQLRPLLRMFTPAGRAAAVERKAEARLALVRALPVGFRIGKGPAVPLAQCVRLEPHLAVLPAPPATLNRVSKLVIGWGMMLNDRLGDCTCAAVGHAIQLMTFLASQVRTLSDAQVLALYEAVSGYNPATGQNDNGAVEADVLARWKAQGVSGDRVAAYGRVDHANVTAVKQVIELFGFAYIGTAVPAAWEQAPSVWGVIRGAAGRIVGGHAVILVDWDDDGFWLISWGRVFKMTYAAFGKYVDEVWGVVSQDWIEQNKLAPSGFPIDALLADLVELEQAA